MTFHAKISMADCSRQDLATNALSMGVSTSIEKTRLDSSSAPDARDIDAFSKMMDEKKRTSMEEKNCTSDDKGNDMPSMASLMAQMASVMHGGTLQGVVDSVVAETASVSGPHFSAKEIDTMLNLLVERITITDTKAHMVTLEVSLAGTALQGTTLHLTRSLDGLLAVNIMTQNGSLFQALVAAQMDLRARLEALDTGMVRVDISQMHQEEHNAQHHEEHDAQHRSAMYQAYADDDNNTQNEA